MASHDVVPSPWTDAFTVGDQLVIDGLPDDLRAVVERYARQAVQFGLEDDDSPTVTEIVGVLRRGGHRGAAILLERKYL